MQRRPASVAEGLDHLEMLLAAKEHRQHCIDLCKQSERESALLQTNEATHITRSVSRASAAVSFLPKIQQPISTDNTAAADDAVSSPDTKRFCQQNDESQVISSPQLFHQNTHYEVTTTMDTTYFNNIACLYCGDAGKADEENSIILCAAYQYCRFACCKTCYEHSAIGEWPTEEEDLWCALCLRTRQCDLCEASLSSSPASVCATCNNTFHHSCIPLDNSDKEALIWECTSCKCVRCGEIKHDEITLKCEGCESVLYTSCDKGFHSQVSPEMLRSHLQAREFAGLSVKARAKCSNSGATRKSPATFSFGTVWSYANESSEQQQQQQQRETGKCTILSPCRTHSLDCELFCSVSKTIESSSFGFPVLLAIILKHMRNNLRCDGQLVYIPPPPPSQLEIYSDNALHTLLTTFLSGSQEGGYEAHVLTVTTYVSLREAWICRKEQGLECAKPPLMVIADDNLSQYILEDARMNRDRYQLISIPYVAVATGFIYNFCKSTKKACNYRYKSPVVLDVTTAANILDGNIRWWNDSAIVALNPMRRIPQEPIIVIAGPKRSSYSMDFVQRVRNKYIPDLAFRLGEEMGYERATFREAWMDVALTPFSISFAVLNATVVEGVETVSLRNDQGVDVAASPESVEACAYDTYDEVNNVFRLDYSIELDCYPLTTTYTIFIATTLQHPAPAILLQTLYRQSLRSTRGDTAVFTNKFGALMDLYVDGVDLAQLNLNLMERIAYPDTMISILRIPHDLNLIPNALSITLYVIMFVECACFFILAVWTTHDRNRKLIRNSSPMFMLQVLFGAVVSALTVIPLSMQGDYAFVRAVPVEEFNTPQPMLDLACMAVPVLFSVGFAITFSAIFLKTWRLIRIFNNSKLRNLFLKDRQLMWYQLLVLVGVAGLNAFWLGLSPLSWERIPGHINEQGLVLSSTGICVAKAGLAPAAPMIIGIVGLLVIGNYLSYLARRIPTEFNESKWTAMSLFFVLEAFVIVVPVLVLANDQPVPGYIVKALACLLLPIATVGFLFVPKLMIAYGIGEDKDDSNPWRFVRASDSSNNNNKKKIGVVVHEEPLASKLVMSSQGFNVTMSPTAAQRTRNQLSTPPASGGSLSTSSKPTNEALAKLLRDDPTSRKFRRYLKTLHNDDNVRFWDAIMITKAEPNESKRYSGIRAVIQSFVCDHAPYHVKLPSATKDAIISAYDNDDKEKLKDPAFFDQAMVDMFDGLRQSDEFRAFMENDAFSKHNLV